MNSENRVQDLLEQLRGEQTNFEISRDTKLTYKVSELLNRIDWDELWTNNIEKVRESHYNDMSGLAYELEQMAGKKDINSLLPSDTRFRFIKRVIRRIMYTITRDQEEFNNEVFKAVQEVKKINAYLNLEILKLEMNLEEKEKELDMIKQQIGKQKKDKM